MFDINSLCKHITILIVDGEEEKIIKVSRNIVLAYIQNNL